jgi:hypothetical protein
VNAVGKPEDLASGILFLTTNTFITGSILDCDGGWKLKNAQRATQREVLQLRLLARAEAATLNAALSVPRDGRLSGHRAHLESVVDGSRAGIWLRDPGRQLWGAYLTLLARGRQCAEQPPLVFVTSEAFPGRVGYRQTKGN